MDGKNITGFILKGAVVVLVAAAVIAIWHAMPVNAPSGGDSADSSANGNNAGHTPAGQSEPDISMAATHKYITGEDAKVRFESEQGIILLDVRNPDEYEQGHVEGSVLIPVSELESRLSELPDKDAVIFVYCRAGRRSAAAYEILTDAGYANVYDMQMVTNWPSPLV